MMKLSLLHYSLLVFLFNALVSVDAQERSNLREIVKFPEKIDPACGDRLARIYDECGDQKVLFDRALQRARNEQKTLLISYGAEWCIWCHVFEKYIHGQVGRFEYNLEGDDVALREKNVTNQVSLDAQSLNSFVADNIIVLHIESESAPGSYEVLEKTGAIDQYDGWLPLIFTVDEQGNFAKKLDHDKVEVRADGLFYWYRGYDRTVLLSELKSMVEAAR